MGGTLRRIRWGFVKAITAFLYNRRCHPFSYSSSRLDPHSDYRRFLTGREKPLCIFSLPSPSLSQSSLTARGRNLYALRMASVYWKNFCSTFARILCMLAKQQIMAVYFGKLTEILQMFLHFSYSPHLLTGYWHVNMIRNV